MELTTHKSKNTNSETNPLEGKGGLFSNYDLSKFKVFNPKTLFPPNFENLQKNKCPICGRKLYLNRMKTMARCKSKVKDKFAITSKRLLALGGSLK